MLSENEAKDGWLKDLSEFIVLANKNTWAANALEIRQPQRPGFKELAYKSPNGLWVYRDSYTGYYRAPGMTTIYYRHTPSWSMSYGGPGMLEDHYDLVKPTFEFLKQALMKVTPELPLRGPEEYVEGSRRYSFEYEGDIEGCRWEETITEDGILTFSQNGFAGVIIGSGSNKLPVYPWDRIPKIEPRIDGEPVAITNAKRTAAKLNPVGGELDDEVPLDKLIIYSFAFHDPDREPEVWINALKGLTSGERRNLSKALRNIPSRSGVHTLADLRKLSFRDLLSYNGVGGATLISLAFKKPEDSDTKE